MAANPCVGGEQRIVGKRPEPPAQPGILLPFVAEMIVLGGLPLALEVLLDGERNLGRLSRAPVWLQWASYAYVATTLIFLHASRASAFIYFQF